MKRKISNSEYHVLEKEFRFLEQTGQLEPDQSRKLLAEYEPTGANKFCAGLASHWSSINWSRHLEFHRR